MNSLQKPEEIYQHILTSVSATLKSISATKMTDEAEELRHDAINATKKIQSSLVTELHSLERNSEWKTFTIAFYGETNAGKSTLIETLRIAFNEDGKVQEHQRFKAKKGELDAIEKRLTDQKAHCAEEHARLDAQLAAITSKQDALAADGQQIQSEAATSLEKHYAKYQVLQDNEDEIIGNYAELLNQIGTLSIQLRTKMLKSNWQLFLSILNRLPEQSKIVSLKKKVPEHKEELLEAGRQLQGESDQIEISVNDWQHKIDDNQKQRGLVEDDYKKAKTAGELQQSAMKHSLVSLQDDFNQTGSELTQLSDGAIVGDGRSDYTQSVNEYTFTEGEKRFAILDLPGIEGKETDVQEQIADGVERAHVVIYVSRQATPPQKGDDKELGTIEKISRQLSQQTEVYFLFNKSVPGPRQLKTPLIDEDEESALIKVDEVMADVFGEQYAGHKVLAALPALIANGVFYGNKLANKQKRFLEYFGDANKANQMTHLPEFTRWLSTNLIVDVKNKIVASNYRKVANAIDNTNTKVRRLYQYFSKLAKKSNANVEATLTVMDKTVATYTDDCDQLVKRNIRTFESDVRKKMYQIVDNGIKNAEFKDTLKQELERGAAECDAKLQSDYVATTKKLTDELKNIIKRFQRYSEELMASSNAEISSDIDVNVEFKFKSVVDKFAIAGALLGFILAIPTGGFSLVLTAVGAALTIVNNVLSALNSGYRKAQQKSNINKNLEKITDQIRAQYSEHMHKQNDEIIKSLNDVKKGITDSSKQIEAGARMFRDLGRELDTLGTQLN